jgi:hypothetical protein
LIIIRNHNEQYRDHPERAGGSKQNHMVGVRTRHAQKYSRSKQRVTRSRTWKREEAVRCDRKAEGAAVYKGLGGLVKGPLNSKKINGVLCGYACRGVE